MRGGINLLCILATKHLMNQNKAKTKLRQLEKKAEKQIGTSSWQLPKVEIIKRGKKEWQ
mgnify:CR=1 FL=1